VSGWLNKIYKLKFVLEFIQKEQIDTVYFITYDTLSLSLLYKEFIKYRMIIHNHDNLSRFSRNVVRRFLFRRLSSFHHVVYSSALNGFIRGYLKTKMGFDSVFFADYQSKNGRDNPKPRSYSPDSILLLAPAGSNDSGKILRLLHSAKSSRIRIKAKVTDGFYLKYSSLFKENLFAGFMAKSEFDGWMEACDFVLLLYPGYYRFRLSALMFEAVNFGKPLITDNEFLYEGWIKEDGIGMFVNKVEDIEEAVLRVGEEHYNRLVENVKTFNNRVLSADGGKKLVKQIETICMQ